MVCRCWISWVSRLSCASLSCSRLGSISTTTNNNTTATTQAPDQLRDALRWAKRREREKDGKKREEEYVPRGKRDEFSRKKGRPRANRRERWVSRIVVALCSTTEIVAAAVALADYMPTLTEPWAESEKDRERGRERERLACLTLMETTAASLCFFPRYSGPISSWRIAPTYCSDGPIRTRFSGIRHVCLRACMLA